MVVRFHPYPQTPEHMADIREGLQGLKEPDRSIGLFLDEFYRNMKSLERDEHSGGKRAVTIIMAMNDLERIMEHSIHKVYDKVKKENDFHYDIWAKSGRTDTSNPYHQGAHCAMQELGEWMREEFKALKHR